MTSVENSEEINLFTFYKINQPLNIDYAFINVIFVLRVAYDLSNFG